jgi:hypothetical protein
MRAPRLILVIAIYVGLDLTNPFMPGVFIFDPAQSVEGVSGERGRQQFVVLAAPAASRVQTDETPPPPRRPAPMARNWFAEPRLAHVPVSDPPPLSEDH